MKETMKATEDFWTGLGITLVCIGIGGCDYLQDKGEAELLKAKQEIRIQNSFNTTNRIEKAP